MASLVTNVIVVEEEARRQLIASATVLLNVIERILRRLHAVKITVTRRMNVREE